MNFFAELKRRHMYRVAAAYAVVAWVLLQLVNNLAQALKLPDWVPAMVVVVLALGFPVALLFAWIQHMVLANATAHETKANRLDFIVVGGIATVIAIFLFQQFASGPTTVTQPKGADVAKSVANSAAGAVSIAVLPFANLSGDASQEFFSDDITKEITSALAKIRALKVIGRTSAFQFKGQNRDLRAIGQSLSAPYLIEGSVRKAGDQVRITAQLIKADDGTYLWTENYDRQLTNIFTTQEDIAQAIAGALSVPLGLAPGETLVSSRTTNLEAYQEWLRGRALMRGLFFEDARKVLESAVSKDPNFAPPWADLSVAYALLPTMSPAAIKGSIEEARQLVQSEWPKAQHAAEEAIRLDPKLATGHMALAFTYVQRSNYVAADAAYQRALALDSDDPIVLHVYGMLQAATGHLAEAMRLREELQRVEPFVPIFNSVSAHIRLANGDKTAIRTMEASIQAGSVGTLWTHSPLAEAYAAEGRYADAANTLLAIEESPLVSRREIQEGARLLRQAPLQTKPESLPDWNEFMSWIYLYVGDPDRALAFVDRRLDIGLIDMFYNLWLPEYAPLRKTGHFKTLMRRMGIVDYWKARGWPDLCRPVGTDDFECN